MQRSKRFWQANCRYCGVEIKWLGSPPPVEVGYGIPHTKAKCAEELRLQNKQPGEVFRKIDREIRGLD